MPFVDEVVVKLRAGNGGDGCLSFLRAKFVPKGGPDGGDGGRGGDVVLVCDENTHDLTDYAYHPEREAQDGEKGMGSQCTGKEGKTLFMRLPLGTDIYDVVSGKKVAELLRHGQEVRLLKGGKGGLGNMHFKTSVNRAPRQTTPGKKGLAGTFRLELRSIADVGLVGFPNAGKSSLINALTNAGSKVGAYPFTTLNPNLGIVKGDKMLKEPSIIIADIPGLIEGAHENRGLGHKFLKHIERCKVLLFVVDAAGSEGREPKKDFQILLKELKEYSNGELLKKPIIVAANKLDLMEKKTLPATTFKIGKSAPAVHYVSALTGEGVDSLKETLRENLSFLKNGE